MLLRAGWKRTLLFLGLMAIASGLLCNPAIGANTAPSTFIVVGTATIQKDNITGARQEAISNSLVSAVGLIASQLLSADDMVTNYEKLNEMLFDNTSKFIRTYKVLTESTVEKTYRVMVQATVSQSRVKNQLTTAGILRAQKTMPRIHFFCCRTGYRKSVSSVLVGHGNVLHKTGVGTSNGRVHAGKRIQGGRTRTPGSTDGL